MLHLYAVLRYLPPEFSALGVDGVSVEMVQHKGLIALTSSCQSTGVPTATQALAHNAVIEQALGQTEAILPMRFTNPYQIGVILQWLEQQQADILQRLGEVANCREFAVRAELPFVKNLTIPTSSGKAYLEAIAQRSDARNALQNALEQQLSPFFQASLHRFEQPYYRGAFLVKNTQQQQFKVICQTILDTHQAFFKKIQLVGAFAPYSFAVAQTPVSNSF